MSDNMKACGDMHNGGYTGYTSSCPTCRRANDIPSIQGMDAALVTSKARVERLEALAQVLCHLQDRDTYVSPEGRPTADEWGRAWQNMTDALGLTGQAASVAA